MIYYTGDIHGSKYEVTRFCRRMNLTRKDTVVLLGDVGANYFRDESDRALKQAVAKFYGDDRPETSDEIQWKSIKVQAATAKRLAAAQAAESK